MYAGSLEVSMIVEATDQKKSVAYDVSRLGRL